jgi:galactonate dehydratase
MIITDIEAIPIRIKRAEAYLGALPPGANASTYFLRPPYRALYSSNFETAFVKVTTSDGVTGWGEALAPVAPEVVSTIINQLLTPVLIGRDPLAGDALWNVMYDLMRERGYYGGFMLDAISACDIALWDIRGQYLNQPVYTLLGGPHRTKIPCYVSGLPKPNDQERAKLAETWVERGFLKFKLAAGYGVKADTVSIATLRQSLGPDASLLLDAHWVYTLDEAITLGRQLETQGAALLEAPLNPEDIDGHIKLAEAVAIPVAIGETERTRYQFKPWLVHRGADVLQPDVGRTGITELMKIAHMAEAFNIPVAPHLSVGLGPCIAASIHAAAAIPNLWLLEYQPPVFELANTLLMDPLVCEQGQYHLPSGPGLGIRIDEQKLRALQREAE